MPSLDARGRRHLEDLHSAAGEGPVVDAGFIKDASKDSVFDPGCRHR